MLLVPTVGPLEVLIVAVVVILLFGVGKLSGLGKDLGSSIKEFRRAMKDDDKQDEAGTAPQAQQPQTVQATVQQQPAQPQAPQQTVPPAAPAPEANSQQPRQDAERPNVF